MSHRNSHITSFVLKIAAIVGMTANHVAHVMGPLMPWEATLVLYSFGGITYPIMAFLLVIGYRHTSNVRRYASRLFLFALASQIPFTLCFGWGPFPIPRLNVLFTLLIGLGLLWVRDHAKNDALFFLAFVAGVAASYFCDWAISGPILVVLFYTLRNRNAWGIVLTMAFLYMYVLVPNALDIGDQIQRGMVSAQNAFDQNLAHNLDIVYVTGIPIHLYNGLMNTIASMGYALVGFTLATVLICRYNGQRGRSMKWFFYAYYPAHLLVIWLLNEVLTTLQPALH